MNLNKIKNTCSMLELGDVLERDLEIKRTDFLIKINKGLRNLEKTGILNKNYTIMYNCTSHIRRNLALRLGFERVFIYKGESKVSVLMFKTYKKPSLFLRIKNFFIIHFN